MIMIITATAELIRMKIMLMITKTTIMNNDVMIMKMMKIMT